MTLRVEAPVSSMTLRDGRRLSYALCGHPRGKPLFVMHNTPGSRRIGQLMHQMGRDHRARIITPDRPGYGFSDLRHPFTVLNWPGDVLELALHLGIDDFGVLGIVGGGPYALACAYRMPERVTRVAILAGVTSVTMDNRHQTRRARFENHLLRLALHLPARVLNLSRPYLMRTLVGTRSKAIDALARSSALITHDDAQIVIDDRIEAFRSSPAGYYADRLIQREPWNINPRVITTPVHLWYSEEDDLIAPDTGRWLAAQLPNARARFFHGGSHIAGYLSRLDHALRVLIATD